MDEAAQGRVYRLSRVGPVSKASNIVRICALNHFEAFLDRKKMPRLNRYEGRNRYEGNAP